MEQLISKYANALARYITLSESAAHFASMGATEQVLSVLKDREKVYANLRALDALAKHQGLDAAENDQIKALGARAWTANQDLMEPLQRVRSHLAAKMQASGKNAEFLRRAMSHSQTGGHQVWKSA